MRPFIKYIIFLLTPHLIFDKISYRFTNMDKDFFREIEGKKNAYIFLGCDYPNLGDYAITISQRNLLHEIYPDRNIYVIEIKRTYSRLKSILYHNDTSDIVTIIGGGNMGELYYGYERKRNFIVKMMHAYKIISFPQL